MAKNPGEISDESSSRSGSRKRKAIDRDHTNKSAPFNSRALVFGVAVASILFAIISTVAFVISLPEFQWRFLDLVGLTESAQEVRYGKESTGDVESVVSERGDHASVVNWVFTCTGTQTLAALPLYARQMYTSNQRQLSSATTQEMPTGTRIPHRHERAFLDLSSGLSGQRTLLREKVRSTYKFWQWCAMVTIGLGLLTTILVSLSSTELGTGEGTRQQIIRTAAIIFPALGTAAAAVVAFYGPQADWSQASRTLTSISQLHGQMALGIWKLNCLDPKDATDPIKAQQLEAQHNDWSKRYIDIQIVASATGQPGPTSGPGPANSRDNPPGQPVTQGGQPSK